jgi:hypothetical protein
VIRLLLGAGVLLLVAACGGEKKTHFSYAKSADCLRGIGKTQLVGGKGQTAARISTDDKVYELLFLPSGAQAEAYTKQFTAPNGRLGTDGNVIIFGHRTNAGVGPDVSSDELNEVKKCLA